MICTLVIKDEVNCKFVGLDALTRQKLVKELEYFIPGAKYTPKYKISGWNGKMSYCTIGGDTYINLLDRLIPIVEDAGYSIEIDDRRLPVANFEFDEIDENSYSHVKWPKGHPLAGKPVVVKEHQVEAVNLYLKNLSGIQILPTSAGKTILSAILSHKIENYGRSIVIVPTKDLVTQTEEDYINMGLDVGVFYGDRKEYNKTHTICTWQSLESLYKKSKNEDLEININDFFNNVVCVIVDEAHKGSASVLRKLLAGPMANVPIRWGMTGTMPEEDINKVAVISCIGTVLGSITAKELQEKGILADLHINIWQMQDYGALAFDNYQSELKWLTTNKIRLQYLANEIIKISETGNTLILVDRIETGKMLESYMPGSIFISGEMKSKDRKEEYKEVQSVDGKILIATYGVASTGISINRIFNLVLFEAGKAFTRVIQSIGRSLRIAEDKTHATIYDVCSNCKYSKRHLAKRKKFYSEAEYPFSIQKINY